MSDTPSNRRPEAARSTASQTATLLLFGATLFLSAFLMFTIEPMFAKVALPLLGGSPEVWNTAMVFFQATLLLGYGYAHLSVKLLGLRRQPLVHLALLALTLLVLPIAAVSWTPPLERSPVLWLIGFLAVSIGAVFFAVSATAPLIQRWFGHMDHPAARDPYFLYGASNIGSIAALIAYPVIIERDLTIMEQELAWTYAYVLLAALIGVCALLSLRRASRASDLLISERVSDDGLNWRQRLEWTLLAFLPSSLLLGVTTYISTDIAATPLFWVVPLTLYLLSFVITFARRPILPHAWMVALQPLLLIPVALLFSDLSAVFWLGNLFVHLLAFFVTAMVCHGELVKRRPATLHLTEFYLWMSLGGVLGGIFNALLAPVIFDDILEYPIVLVLACLLRPRAAGASGWSSLKLDLLIAIAIMALLTVPIAGSWQLSHRASAVLALILCTLMLISMHKRYRFAMVFAITIFGIAALGRQFEHLVQERSFFGVNRVMLDKSGEFNLLMHGTTLHGAEHRTSATRTEPLTYYSKVGPLGQLFAGLEQSASPVRIGLIGLGVGTTLCYRNGSDQWTIFEIDPVVVTLAHDQRYFHFLGDCAGDSPIMLGDARLSLVKTKPHEFDLLILDAFSSDAIPVHLLTREALALYLNKLTENGVLAFHITNRRLDLGPIVANLAADAGLVAYIQEHKATADMRENQYIRSSTWVVMSRAAGNLASLLSGGLWTKLEPQANMRLWTDDYSNILTAMRWTLPTFARAP
jgi:hypothetical protein